MDDKTEDVGVIVEEGGGGGGVGSQKSTWSDRNDFPNTARDGEGDDSEKGDNEDPYAGWDDVYEQEV
jgi:hypothetical protein